MFFSKDPGGTARLPARPRGDNSDSIEDGANFDFDKVSSNGRGGTPAKGVRVIPLEEVNLQRAIYYTVQWTFVHWSWNRRRRIQSLADLT